MKRLLLISYLLVGCKKPVDTAPITAEAAGLQQNENDLLGRRGALQRERTELTEQRKQLLEKRAQLGHDTVGQATLDEEDKKLAAKETDLAGEETVINGKLDELLHARAELVSRATTAVAGSNGPDPLERAAHREQGVAEREKSVAKREADVADRESKLAARETAEAKREKDTCGAPSIINVAAAPPGSGDKSKKYSAHDVEPVYKKAQRIMQERGILSADLPPGSNKLLDDTRDAMKAQDWTRAKYSADALLATVEQIKIDRNFIAAKMARLASTMRGKKLEGDSGKTTEGLFRDATANYGDGRFTDANQKINKLFQLLK